MKKVAQTSIPRLPGAEFTAGIGKHIRKRMTGRFTEFVFQDSDLAVRLAQQKTAAHTGKKQQ
jgi:hypothetical protein